MKISAIVSAYYAEPYLAGRIDNLIHQRPRPEIIIVCQEGSKEHEIAEKYNNVIIVTTLDIPTIYKAWNMGIERAHGEYITNANTDDRLYPGALQKLSEALDRNKRCGVAYSNLDIVTEVDGEPIGRFDWIEGGVEQLLNGCFLGPMPMWRKELHTKYGLFDESYHVAGDYEFWLRIAARGIKFYHIKESLGVYARRERGAELREPLRTTWETARAKSKYRSWETWQ